MRAREILEACLYAHDLDAAERFYAGVLGLEVFARVEGRHLFFRAGGRMFLVFDPRRTREGGGEIPAHGTDGPGHVCFAIGDDEVERWRTRLDEMGVEVERELTWPSGGRSLYLRDPAGNSVELGTPRIWEIPDEAVFGGG